MKIWTENISTLQCWLEKDVNSYLHILICLSLANTHTLFVAIWLKHLKYDWNTELMLSLPLKLTSHCIKQTLKKVNRSKSHCNVIHLKLCLVAVVVSWAWNSCCCCLYLPRLYAKGCSFRSKGGGERGLWSSVVPAKALRVFSWVAQGSGEVSLLNCLLVSGFMAVCWRYSSHLQLNIMSAYKTSDRTLV